MQKVSLNAKFDWSAIKYQEQWPDGHTLAVVCGEAVVGVGDVCRVSEDAMKTVQSKVKGVICKEASPSGFSFSNGILTYGMDLKNDANTADRTRKFLMDKL